MPVIEKERIYKRLPRNGVAGLEQAISPVRDRPGPSPG